MTSFLAGAALVGFLGSLHCLFMCGPLACAGCRTGANLSLPSAALYFGGRLASYVFAGALFGALGAHLGCWIHLELLQTLLLVVVAVVALARGIRLWLGAAEGERLVQLRPQSFGRRAAGFVSALVPKRALSLGLATGGLPCGLLASGWALAAATGSPLRGTLVMGVFSFATAPALVAALWAGGLARHARWRASTRWQGLLWCLLAVWIMARSVLAHGAHAGGH